MAICFSEKLKKPSVRKSKRLQLFIDSNSAGNHVNAEAYLPHFTHVAAKSE